MASNRRELVRYTPSSNNGNAQVMNTLLEGGGCSITPAGGPGGRDLEKISYSADSIPKDVIDEIICRFLINLPESEARPPRVFHHIKEACWFYADNFCTITPKM